MDTRVGALSGVMTVGNRREEDFGIVPDTWDHPGEPADSHEMNPRTGMKFKRPVSYPVASRLFTHSKVSGLGSVKLGFFNPIEKAGPVILISVGTGMMAVSSLAAYATLRGLNQEKSTFWTVFRVIGSLTCGAFALNAALIVVGGVALAVSGKGGGILPELPFDRTPV